MRILFDPEPRAVHDIFTPADQEKFLARYDVVAWQGEDRESFYRKHLPDAEVVISQ